VEGCVASIGEVWVFEIAGVVLDDALDEGEVVEVDGAAEADGDVDPVVNIRRRTIALAGGLP